MKEMFSATIIYALVWILIHSLNKYILSINYMLVTYASTGDSRVQKPIKSLTLRSLSSSGEEIFWIYQCIIH